MKESKESEKRQREITFREQKAKTEKKKNKSETTGKWGGESKEKETQRENGKEGEIVPDLDLRGSGPSDVSIS